MGKLQNFKNNCIELRDFTTKTVKKPKNTQNPIENVKQKWEIKTN